MTNSSVKCVRDLRDFPPSSYRLPTDGRQWKHLCQQRQRLAWQLATYANGDGSSITAGVETWAKAMGLSRRAVTYLLDDLCELQLLQNGKLTRFNGTRERALDIEAFAARIADAQSTPDAQSSIADAQSTRTCCAIYATPDAQSSAVLAPIPPEDCALPTDRPTPSIPIQTGTDGGKEVLSQKPFATQKAQPTDSESESAMGDEEPTEEEQAAAEAAAEKSFAEFQWQQLMAGIPDVLQGALMLHGQRAEIEKLVAKHGPDRLLASIARWIDYRELPIEGRKTNKWGALLEEIAPHIAQVRKDDRQKRRRQNR